VLLGMVAMLLDLVMGSGDTPRIPASAGSGGGDGALAGEGGGRAAGGGADGSGWSTVVDLVMGSGAIPRIPFPENWPFTCPFLPQSEIKSMVTQTRTWATKRMTGKSLTKSAQKEHTSCTPSLPIRTRNTLGSAKTFCLKWGLRIRSRGCMICSTSC
jgi:hypothetical protein